MTNLYDALHITPDADSETIKTAYRKMAAKTHPDTGGSVESFALVKHAYDILSDDERRKKYDTTGDASENQPNNQMTMVLETVQRFMEQTFTAIDSQNRDPLKCDVIAMMLAAIQEETAKTEKAISDGAAALGNAEKIQIRFTVKEGENYIVKMMQWKLDSFRKKQEALTTHLELLHKAQEIVSLHSFAKDAEDPIEIMRRQGMMAQNYPIGFGPQQFQQQFGYFR